METAGVSEFEEKHVVLLQCEESRWDRTACLADAGDRLRVRVLHHVTRPVAGRACSTSSRSVF